MDDKTVAAQAADVQAASAPALGEAGFAPHPHAEDAELAQLEAEAANPPSPEASDPPAPPPSPKEASESQGEPPSPRTSEGAGDKPISIPKARFDEAVLRERERAERAIAVAAYYKGQLDAHGNAAAAEITPQQEAQQLEAAIEQKATDFDEGRIGLAEFKRFERQAQQRLAVLQQPAERPDSHQDMTLEERTAELPGRFPVLAQIDGPTYLALQPMAENQLLREGVKLDTGPWSSFKIRERMALIAQKNYGDPAAPEASQDAGPQPQPTGRPDPARPDRSDPTRNARDKLALAGRMPPNLAKSGTAQVPQDRYSLQSVAGMDLDEMATALPDSVLRQLSGQ